MSSRIETQSEIRSVYNYIVATNNENFTYWKSFFIINADIIPDTSNFSVAGNSMKLHNVFSFYIFKSSDEDDPSL
ncbi:uncharacterized protein OCT59_013472 [Rhizophagus irregularis]|uniref:uncharacterized protein n=1 Tax=Rhizophagus irregularis TaxID=588596 RepID=UPI0019E470D5|nr:hypothetical protein OCT59_013472 [Rhizophagus irregularis]GBC45572.2 hypothetical protein RIR_jg16214.t1 [Rhizophagus irregularis DAOM 181602=DAOM 197198]